MSESRAKRLQHLLVQGLVIVFSILVAFVAEDWRSGREDQRAVDEALAALTSEVETNAESLEGLVDVVTARHERLVALAPTVDGSRPFSDYTGGFTGYRLSGLDRSAWGRISADPVANRMASTQLREAFAVYLSQEPLLALDGESASFVEKLVNVGNTTADVEPVAEPPPSDGLDAPAAADGSAMPCGLVLPAARAKLPTNAPVVRLYS